MSMPQSIAIILTDRNKDSNSPCQKKDISAIMNVLLSHNLREAEHRSEAHYVYEIGKRAAFESYSY
jgi:hypothetical protein